MAFGMLRNDGLDSIVTAIGKNSRLVIYCSAPPHALLADVVPPYAPELDASDYTRSP